MARTRKCVGIDVFHINGCLNHQLVERQQASMVAHLAEPWQIAGDQIITGLRAPGVDDYLIVQRIDRSGPLFNRYAENQFELPLKRAHGYKCCVCMDENAERPSK